MNESPLGNFILVTSQPRGLSFPP